MTLTLLTRWPWMTLALSVLYYTPTALYPFFLLPFLFRYRRCKWTLTATERRNSNIVFMGIPVSYFLENVPILRRKFLFFSEKSHEISMAFICTNLHYCDIDTQTCDANILHFPTCRWIRFNWKRSGDDNFTVNIESLWTNWIFFILY